MNRTLVLLEMTCSQDVAGFTWNVLSVPVRWFWWLFGLCFPQQCQHQAWRFGKEVTDALQRCTNSIGLAVAKLKDRCTCCRSSAVAPLLFVYCLKLPQFAVSEFHLSDLAQFMARTQSLTRLEDGRHLRSLRTASCGALPRKRDLGKRPDHGIWPDPFGHLLLKSSAAGEHWLAVRSELQRMPSLDAEKASPEHADCSTKVEYTPGIEAWDSVSQASSPGTPQTRSSEAMSAETCDSSHDGERTSAAQPNHQGEVHQEP
eukprot:g6103.t1